MSFTACKRLRSPLINQVDYKRFGRLLQAAQQTICQLTVCCTCILQWFSMQPITGWPRDTESDNLFQGVSTWFLWSLAGFQESDDETEIDSAVARVYEVWADFAGSCWLLLYDLHEVAWIGFVRSSPLTSRNWWIQDVLPCKQTSGNMQFSADALMTSDTFAGAAATPAPVATPVPETTEVRTCRVSPLKLSFNQSWRLSFPASWVVYIIIYIYSYFSLLVYYLQRTRALLAYIQLLSFLVVNPQKKIYLDTYAFKTHFRRTIYLETICACRHWPFCQPSLNQDPLMKRLQELQRHCCWNDVCHCLFE